MEDPPYYAFPLGRPRLKSWITRVDSKELALLALSFMPLLDGVFIATAGSGALRAPAGIAGFGFSAFSGAGCVTVAATLDGSLGARLSAVCRVYLLVLAGALLSTFCLPLIQALATPDLPLYGALLLLSLAAGMWGIEVTPSGPLPNRPGARWTHCLRLLAVPQVVMAVLLAVSTLHVVASGVHPRTPLPASAALGSAAAVLVGMLVTMSAALLAGKMRTALNQRILRRLGAALLLLIALHELGLPLPGLLTPLALLTGLPAALYWSPARAATLHVNPVDSNSQLQPLPTPTGE